MHYLHYILFSHLNVHSFHVCQLFNFYVFNMRQYFKCIRYEVVFNSVLVNFFTINYKKLQRKLLQIKAITKTYALITKLSFLILLYTIGAFPQLLFLIRQRLPYQYKTLFQYFLLHSFQNLKTFHLPKITL